jgi:tetratricopeptide (TPR) repeat protein
VSDISGAPTAGSIEHARSALAEAYLRTGDYDAVDLVAERALARAAASGDRRAEAAALSLQGMTLHFRAIDVPADQRSTIDPGPEETLFERALAVRRELGDVEGIAESLFQLGLVHQVLRQDLEAGAPCFREALALVERVPDADLLLRSEIHRHVGFDLLLREERHEAALEHLRTSLDLRLQLPERGWAVSALVALSLGERLAGRAEVAVACSREALELARDEDLRPRFLTGAEDALCAAEDLQRQSRPL